MRRAELMEKEARAIKQRSEEQAAALLLAAENELMHAEMEAQRKKEEASKKIAAAEMLEEVSASFDGSGTRSARLGQMRIRRDFSFGEPDSCA